MHVLGIIPVRLASERLNEKALVEIEGKPLVVHTYLNAKNLQKQGLLNDLVVATDSEKIVEIIKNCDSEAKVFLTPESCRSGVERISAVLQQIPPQKNNEREIVVNIQGDEPMFCADNLRKLLSFFADAGAKNAAGNADNSAGTGCADNSAGADNSVGVDNSEGGDNSADAGGTDVDNVDEAKDAVEISTLAVALDKKKALNPNIVKVVFSAEGRAIYFSRALIPYNRDERQDVIYYKHLGIYAYKRSFLEEKFPFLPHTPLEDIEKIEQLCFLGAGCPMMVGVVQQAGLDINVQEDVEAFAQYLQKNQCQ